jgi:hypothetical protein
MNLIIKPYAFAQQWFQILRLNAMARRKTPEASCATYEKEESARVLWRTELGPRWGFETTASVMSQK